MSREECTLIVFARAPIPGQAKTRLIPALGAEGAAALQQTLLERTLAMAAQLHDCRVELWCHPDTSHPAFQHVAARHDLTLVSQRGNDLGERMANAFETTLRKSRYALIIGTDCPQLGTEDIVQGIHRLRSGSDAVLGPAADGGYYLLGLSRFAPSLFEDIEWGGNTVLATTRRRLEGAAMQWHEMAIKHDLDRPGDLQRFPELHLTDTKGA